MSVHIRTGAKPAGILGIGNLLLRDEGFGVHVVRYLEARYLFPGNVRIMDGGTAGIYMAPFIEETDPLLVIDVVAMDGPAGTTRFFRPGEMRSGRIQASMSPHQVGLMEVLEICRLRGNAPSHMEFVGIVPGDVSTGIGLSSTLESKVEVVANMVTGRLADFGFRIQERQVG